MMNCNFVPELLNTNDYKINYEMRKGAIQIQVVSPKPKIPVGIDFFYFLFSFYFFIVTVILNHPTPELFFLLTTVQ